MSVGPTNPKPDEEFQLPSMINAILDGEVTRGTGMGKITENSQTKFSADEGKGVAV